MEIRDATAADLQLNYLPFNVKSMRKRRRLRWMPALQTATLGLEKSATSLVVEDELELEQECLLRVEHRRPISDVMA